MKRIKDLREQYDLITEKEEHDMNKLTQLVRAGLFDAKKLSALKRAMDKSADKMTAQEKRMMINLLDALMAEVLSDKQVYRKIKQDVMKEAKDWETKDYYSKNDPRFGRGFPTQSQMPSVLLLKRKGIRVFPDGQKIGLYYAQAIDKYVSIPFEAINIGGHSVNEEAQFDEGFKDFVGRALGSLANTSSSSSDTEKKEPKYLQPGEAGKTRLNIGGPKDKEDDGRPDAIRSRTERLNRMVNQAMAKDVRESFQNNLEVLREAVRKIQPGVDDEGTEGARQHYGTGGITNPAALPDAIGGPSREKGSEAGYGGRRVSIASGSLRRSSQSLTKSVQQRVRNVQQQVRDTKSAEYAKKAWKDIEAGKAKPKPVEKPQPDTMPEFKPYKPDTSPKFPGKPANVPERTKPSGPLDKPANEPSAPKPATPKPVEPKPGKRVEPPKVKPIKVEPKVTPVPPDRKEPDVKPAPKKPTTPAREEPAYKPKPAARPEFPGALPAAKPSGKPSIAPTQQPSSQPAPLKQPQNQPWKDAAKWAQTQAQPAAQPAAQNRPKPDEEGTKKREPEEKGKVGGRPPWWLPGLALGATAGKPLTPGPTKLSLNVSGPKREGDPSAIASRQASLERRALKAQSSLKESVNLDGNKFKLNTKEARKVTALYESLNKKNKKKMVEMMNESAESLEKVISFAVRQ